MILVQNRQQQLNGNKISVNFISQNEKQIIKLNDDKTTYKN